MWQKAKRLVTSLGYRAMIHGVQRFSPPDLTAEDLATVREARSNSMTSIERLYALVQATEYVVAAGIPGAIVECGVWRGGSMQAVALTLRRLGVDDRDLFLFDTFEGMVRPEVRDRSVYGTSAGSVFRRRARSSDTSSWCYAPIEHVSKVLESTGYGMDRVRLVKGRVETTIPGYAPSEIALLRLDTDWYESTKHELVHLFPRLAPGGVLIIDDYGHWEGCRQAVDEYVAENDLKILLNRIDYTGRIGIKS